MPEVAADAADAAVKPSPMMEIKIMEQLEVRTIVHVMTI